MSTSQKSTLLTTCPQCGSTGQNKEPPESGGVNQTDFSLTSKKGDVQSLSASFSTPSMPGGSSQTCTCQLCKPPLENRGYTRSVRCVDGTTVVCRFQSPPDSHQIPLMSPQANLESIYGDLS